MALKQGDKVSWNTSQGPTHGVAESKRIKAFTHDGQHFNASADDPYWIVRSDKSGATAAHKESSLRPI
jgi:hypothetical protein